MNLDAFRDASTTARSGRLCTMHRVLAGLDDDQRAAVEAARDDPIVTASGICRVLNAHLPDDEQIALSAVNHWHKRRCRCEEK